MAHPIRKVADMQSSIIAACLQTRRAYPSPGGGMQANAGTHMLQHNPVVACIFASVNSNPPSSASRGLGAWCVSGLAKLPVMDASASCLISIKTQRRTCSAYVLSAQHRHAPCSRNPSLLVLHISMKRQNHGAHQCYQAAFSARGPENQDSLLSRLLGTYMAIAQTPLK